MKKAVPGIFNPLSKVISRQYELLEVRSMKKSVLAVSLIVLLTAAMFCGCNTAQNAVDTSLNDQTAQTADDTSSAAGSSVKNTGSIVCSIGDTLYFVRHDSAGNTDSICSVPQNGGEVRELYAYDKNIYEIRPVDSTHLVIVDRYLEPMPENTAPFYTELDLSGLSLVKVSPGINYDGKIIGIEPYSTTGGSYLIADLPVEGDSTDEVDRLLLKSDGSGTYQPLDQIYKFGFLSDGVIYSSPNGSNKVILLRDSGERGIRKHSPERTYLRPGGYSRCVLLARRDIHGERPAYR